MKKFFKVFFLIIFFFIAILLVAPFVFKGKIMEVAKTQINNNINAKADFSNLKLSFFKSFPNLSIELTGLSVIGIDDFENDTLVAFKAFGVTADPISAIKGENIQIKEIILDGPVLHGKVLEDGRANWDIAKTTDEVEEEEVDTTSSEIPDLKIELKRFAILNADIEYDDQSSGMMASLDNFNFELKGDFTKDFSELEINSKTDALNFVMDNMSYVKDATLDIVINIAADLLNSKYELKENEFSINALTLGIDGVFSMPEDMPMDFDLTFYTKQTEFKTLLSMVPAIYMKDFADVQTKGQLKLDGFVKGKYAEGIMPNVGLELAVNDAMFKYPDLPKSVENIGVDVNLNFDGTDNDNTTIDVNKFHLEIADNPIDLTLNLKTPMSDPSIVGNLTCNIDMASLADAVPIEDTEIKGAINANLDMMGTLSMIEEERYEDFKADGQVVVDNFLFNSPDLPKAFELKHTEVLFSPKFVEIAALDAKLGKSDFQFTGKLENFIPYAMADQTLEGSFIFTSSLLDLNELMPAGEEEVEVEDTTETPMTVVEVPSNLDITLYSNLNKIYFDKLEIDNAKGTIAIRDSRILLDGLQLSTLGGSMQVDGEYNTVDISAPMVDLGLKLTDINIPSAYSAFNSIEKLAPVAKNLNGNVSAGIEFTSFLDSTMSPILNTLVGGGSLSTKTVEVTKSNTISKLTSALNTKAFDDLSLKDVDVDFEIRNGRVYVDPFDIKLGKTTMVIAGDQGIDQTLNYSINMVMPRTGLGESAMSSLTSALTSQGINYEPSENVNLDVAVGGTFLDPTVKPNLKKSSSRSVEQIKNDAINTAKVEVEKKKEEVKAQASAQAEKILQDAEKEAEKIKALAKEAADAVRKESNDNADKLVEEAKNPIAKKAAEVAVDKVRKQGEEKAQKIEDEAAKKAEAVLQRAQEEADRLK